MAVETNGGALLLIWTEGKGEDEDFQFVGVPKDTPKAREFLLDYIRPGVVHRGGDVNWDTVALYQAIELPPEFKAIIPK